MPVDIASAAGGKNGSAGIRFLVAAGIVFEIIAFACSSPQTTEINIGTRGRTLMKWVHLGEALGALFVILAAAADRDYAHEYLAGGALAIVSSELFYRHAKAAGLASPGQPVTEHSYAPIAAGDGSWGARWA